MTPHGNNVGPGGSALPTYSPFWNVLNLNAKIYICPSDPAQTGNGGWNSGQSSYAYNAQVFPVYWNGYHHFPASISDGTSNTIFFTEQRASCTGFWPDWGPSIEDASWPQPTGPASKFNLQPPGSACPYQTNGQNDGTKFIATSPHTGGINVGLGDGSVRFVSAGISGNTWWYAMTPAAGEVLGSDW